MQTTVQPVRGGDFQVELFEAGHGPPLLFLHGIGGHQWDACLDQLARTYRVIAPCTPGFGETSGSDHLQDVQDLIYFYLDLIDALDLHELPVAGHSFGGLIAAELAAVQPQRFTRLVLISSLGLWDDHHPVLDFFASTPPDLAEAMYHDQDFEPARAMAAAPRARMIEVDPETDEGRAVIDYFVERAKSMSTLAKYLWPIPNKGLSKRLHRVTQPTLLIWGKHDGICPPEYGHDFKAALPDARLEIIADAAHMVTTEQPARVAGLIENFLSDVCPRGNGE